MFSTLPGATENPVPISDATAHADRALAAKKGEAASAGQGDLIRYCDDFVIRFEREDDARRVMEVLGKRLGRCGLSLHPDKTRLVPFRRPPVRQRGGKGPATFDFLAFTLYWGYSGKGKWGMWCKTRSARLRLAIQSVYDWCRSLS